MKDLPRSALVYVLGVVALGALNLFWAAPPALPGGPVLVQAALFVALAVLADLKQVQIRSANYSVATAINFACAVVLGTDVAVLASAIGSTAGDVAKRKPLYRTAFNAAAIGISVAAGGRVMDVLRRWPEAPSPLDLPAFAGYALANLSTNYLLVCTAIALASRGSIAGVVRANYRGVFVPLVAMYPLGVLMAVVYIHFGGWVGLLLLVAPVIAAYVALARARQLREANAELRATAIKNAELLAQLTEAHEQLKQAQEQVVQQERLRALGQMASGIAHDFNNALAPVVGFSELLLMQPETWRDAEYLRENLTLINTSARDAASVVRHLREFYRQKEEGDRLLPVDVNPLVRQAVDITQARWRDQALAAGTTIEVGTELGPVPPVAADEAAVRELLTNLIFNAVDAMPNGGTITLRTRAAGGRLLLEVTDTGTGMTEEVRQRCLDPFFSTKGARGTGLGLSMVHGIVVRHEGVLEIESEWGKGTTVRVSFPGCASQEVALPSGDHQAPAPAAAGERRLHVLVVDDEPGARDVVVAYLTSYGHTSDTASNGHEGLMRFRAGRYDVVITDQAMPDMNGDHLAAAVKTYDPHVPVLMLTGFGDMIAATGEKPAGVDAVLAKPVLYADLRRALSDAVDRNGPGSAAGSPADNAGNAARAAGVVTDSGGAPTTATTAGLAHA